MALNCLAVSASAQGKSYSELLSTDHGPSCELLEKWEQEFESNPNPYPPALRIWVKVSLAKCGWNPLEKYNRFTEGTAQLDQLIQSDSNNYLARFLRLTIQEHSPGFLGYDANISEDKVYIANTVDTALQEEIGPLVKKYLEKHP